MRAGSGRRDDVDSSSFAIELDDAVGQRKERIVGALSDVAPGEKLGADLSHQNVAGPDLLAAESLHAAALTVRITAVSGRALSFFVCHGVMLLGPVWSFGAKPYGADNGEWAGTRKSIGRPNCSQPCPGCRSG